MALAEVKHPPFTRGKKQLEKVEVDWSRELSRVRIQQKFTILQGTIPITLVTDNTGQNMVTIDKIVRVCCALVNLCSSLFPKIKL